MARSTTLLAQILLGSKSALRFASRPFLSYKWVRAAYFDSANPNTLLLSTIGTESFLVSSSDKVIGRGIFVKRISDFEKLEKALSLLDSSFHRMLLVDVGANIGTICIPAIKRNCFEKAIAIEPEPFNYSLLVSNININGLARRITPYNLAFGAEAGELIFELSDKNYGDHRIRVSNSNGLNGEARRKTIEVKSEPFDEVVGAIGPGGTLIWIDTQGFEGFVLKGAKKALETKPPLVIEFWPYGMNRCGSYGLLKHVITEAGYSVFYDLNLDASPTQVSEEALDEVFRRLGEDGKYTDLLII